MSGPWLVLPTYNEAENVEAIVRASLAQLASAAPDHRVLVVDDSSPDGTGEIADRLAAEIEQVEVLHRPAKQGLGRAYLAGFERALEGGADLILEMDADFSHDPADLPRLIAGARDADLVLGSRYAEGGGVTDWGLPRRLLSRGGSWYARRVLGVGVRDLTGGFKCFRRELLECLPLDDVQADGYGFQIEMTYRALRAGFRVTEVPILFRDRRAGRSKMNARIALEAVWKVPALRARLRAKGRYILYSKRTTRSPDMAGNFPEVTDDNFQAEVIESDTPVLVDFWAPWCGPCRIIAPSLEEINDEQDNLRVVKLNVDENQAIAARYDVMSIPTLIVFKNGEIAKKIIGALPKKRLEQEIEPALA